MTQSGDEAFRGEFSFARLDEEGARKLTGSAHPRGVAALRALKKSSDFMGVEVTD